MEREILFRGKRKDILPGNEWVYGCLVNLIPNEPEIAFAVDENEMYQYEAVVDETVGQYAGYTDKNGRKIFEGDIVKIDDEIAGIVKYTDEGFIIDSDEFFAADEDTTFEIIGNAYDNPELLKGE